MSFLVPRKTQTETQSITPTVTPEFSNLKDLLINQATSRLATDPNLTGYEGSGLAGINKTFDTTATADQNDLTRRGLSTSPVAAAVDANRSNARSSTISSFENSLPLLSRSLQDQDASSILQLITGLGKGSSSVGRTDQKGSTVDAIMNYYKILAMISGGAAGG